MARKTIAQQLRKLLEDDPRTINAIANESGIPQPVLYRFYTGERDIKLETADKLFQLYELGITK